MRLTQIGIALSLFVASTSLALPPGAEKRGLRDGANHHTGDDSFVDEFGRAPRRTDDEKLRMRVHFKHVRAWLASRPATRPDLQAKREKLLTYLDEYIEQGITPKNIDLGWRTPVFIDHENTICAVGYLIEQSVGRSLPEKIAATHRFSYIEDIARVMPEVKAWVEESGLTLEEIASIQPGYEGPEIDQYQRWVLNKMKNGAYAGTESGFAVAGGFRRHQMNGEWTKTEVAGELHRVRGTGTFVMGSGAWRSNFKTGSRMAEGKFAGSHPTGKWRFYHPSGNLAAEGKLEGTARRGTWRFYYDTPAMTVFAKGDLNNSNGWQYFDEAGKLVATIGSARPKQWRDAWARQITVESGADNVRYQIHIGGVSWSRMDAEPPAQWSSKLESFELGEDHVFAYTHHDGDGEDEQADAAMTYDANGHKLERVAGGWQTSDCKWSKARKQAARADLARLHGLLKGSDKDVCGAPTAVPAARAQQLDVALATRHHVRAPIPAFVDQIASYENDPSDAGDAAAGTEDELVEGAPVTDLVSFASGGSDHFDTRFIQVFRTIPGTRHLWD